MGNTTQEHQEMLVASEHCCREAPRKELGPRKYQLVVLDTCNGNVANAFIIQVKIWRYFNI